MGMGHRLGALADLRQNKFVSQILPQRISLQGGQKPKFLSHPQGLFFFPAENLLAAEMSQGS